MQHAFDLDTVSWHLPLVFFGLVIASAQRAVKDAKQIRVSDQRLCFAAYCAEPLTAVWLKYAGRRGWGC